MECKENSMECKRKSMECAKRLYGVYIDSMECNRNRQHRDVRSHSQSYVLVWVWVKFVVVKWHNSLVWCTYMGSTHTDRSMVVLTLVRALRIHQSE